MKTYVITLSRVFPVKHRRAGQETLFRAAFQNGQACSACKQRKPAMCAGECFSTVKIHTIRANYPLWEKRIKEVQDGVACISLREWTGKPYASPQAEIRRLTAKDGVGFQKLTFSTDRDGMANLNLFCIDGRHIDCAEMLSKNDGLTVEDWRNWFKDYDLSQPLVIIHFTPFRY